MPRFWRFKAVCILCEAGISLPKERAHKKPKLRSCWIPYPIAAIERPPVEVFPFDTGALRNGLLEEDIHPSLSPFDFALEPEVGSAQKLARLFFGSEKYYFKGVKDREAILPMHGPTDADVVAYCSLISRRANHRADERCTSIEMQFKDSMDINGKILAVILPQDFLDDHNIKLAITTAHIEPIAYEFIPDHKVDEYVGIFYSEAEKFYSRLKNKKGWEW